MEVVATAPDNDGDWGRAAAAIDDGWGGRDDVTEAGGAQRDRATGAAAPNPDEGAFWATALGDRRGGATASDAPRHAATARRLRALLDFDAPTADPEPSAATAPPARVLESPSPTATAPPPAAGAESPPAAAPSPPPPACEPTALPVVEAVADGFVVTLGPFPGVSRAADLDLTAHESELVVAGAALADPIRVALERPVDPTRVKAKWRKLDRTLRVELKAK